MEDEKETLTVAERIKGWVKKRPLATVFLLFLAAAVAVVGYWAIWADGSPAWTGFGAYDEEVEGVRAKTLWDWLGLLIVPAALAVGAYWFNRTQKETELKIAEKARQAEQDIAQSRQRQATLEAYYDRMTELLLAHNLRESEPESEVRSIANARTIAVVRSLDRRRNGQLFAFLQSSKLMGGYSPIISFAGAYLPHVDLRGADLRGATLFEADLRKAYLRGANLSGVNLIKAKLSEADLYLADLVGADLSRAQMGGANLTEANLEGAYFGKANLTGANLIQAKLSEANLIRTNLSEANLSKANLSNANLSEANLSEAKLFDANLLGADLSGATNWTIKQFDSVITLEAATMPDGVRLGGPDHDGPTYAQWKAQYLAKQAGR